MSKHKRDLTAEEKALWRRAAASVKQRRRNAAEPEQPPEGPKAKPPTRTLRAFGPSSSPKPQPAQPPPADRAADKRVRRGKVEIGATLDLHGHTQDSGQAALARFLRAAYARGERAVIVITGAGRAGEGVLKRRLPDWLASEGLRPLVSGYAQAHRSLGGAGAFYVFLKRRRAP